MEKKIIVGIDINEVIRGRWQKFDQCYEKEFGSKAVEGITGPFNTFNFRNHYKFEDRVEITEVMNEDILDNDDFKSLSPLEYVVDEKTGKAPVDSYMFKKETKFISGDEAYKTFLYETYGFDIFAAAPLLYRNADLDIQKFFKKYKDQIDLRIVSKDNILSIPFTLSFLSRVRTRFSSYHFSENNDELWSHVDVMITTDPELLQAKPENKKVIKLTRLWNLNESSDLEKINVIDLYENSEFETLVGYVNQPKEITEETKIN